MRSPPWLPWAPFCFQKRSFHLSATGKGEESKKDIKLHNCQLHLIKYAGSDSTRNKGHKFHNTHTHSGSGTKPPPTNANKHEHGVPCSTALPLSSSGPGKGKKIISFNFPRHHIPSPSCVRCTEGTERSLELWVLRLYKTPRQRKRRRPRATRLRQPSRNSVFPWE